MASKRLNLFGRIVLWTFVALVVLAGFGALVAKRLFDAGVFDEKIQEAAWNRAGIDLQFERITYSFPTTLSILRPKVKAAGTPEDVPAITSESLGVTLDILSLPEIRPTELEIVGLEFELELGPDYRPVRLPGGFDRQSFKSGQTFEQTFKYLPKQIRLRNAALQLKLPDGWKLSNQSNVEVQFQMEGGRPKFFIDSTGTAGILRESFDYRLRIATDLEKFSAPIRLKVESRKLGDVDAVVTLKDDRVKVKMELSTNGTSLERIRDLALRLGQEVPEITGLLKGSARINGEWKTTEAVPTQLTITTESSIEDGKLVMAEGKTIEWKRASLTGVWKGSRSEAEPEIKFESSLLSLERLVLALNSEQSVSVQKVDLEFEGACREQHLKTSGKFTAQYRKDRMNGNFEISFDTEKLKVNRFTLDWPGLMKIDTAEATVSGFHTERHLIEKASLDFSDANIEGCISLLRPFLPAEVKAWTASGKISGGVVVENLAIPTNGTSDHLPDRAGFQFHLTPSAVAVVRAGDTKETSRRLKPFNRADGKIMGKAVIRNGDFSLIDYEAAATLDFDQIRLPWKGLEPLTFPKAEIDVRTKGNQQIQDVTCRYSIPVEFESLSGDFRLSVKNDSLKLHRLLIQWPLLGNLLVNGEGDLKTGTVTSASLKAEKLDASNLIGFARHLGVKIPQYPVEGKLDASARFGPLVLFPVVSEATRTKVQATPLYLYVATGGLSLTHTIQKPPIAFLGSEPLETKTELSGSLRAEVDVLNAAVKNIRLESVLLKSKTTIPLAGKTLSVNTETALGSSNVELKSVHIELPGIGEILLEGKAARSSEHGVSGKLLRSSSWAKLTMSLLGITELKLATGSFQFDDLNRLFAMAKPWLPKAFDKYEYGGRISGNLSAGSVSLAGLNLPDQVSGELTLEKGSAVPHDPNAIEGIEELDFKLKWGVTSKAKDAPLAWHISGELTNGLFYRDFFIVDMTGRRLDWQFEGEANARGNRFNGIAGRLELPDELRIEWDDFDVALSPLSYRGRIRINRCDNEKVLNDLQVAAGEGWPWLADVKLTGQAKFGASVEGGAGRTMVEGKLLVTGADFTFGSLELKGARLDFPLSLQMPAAAKDRPAEPSRFGVLEIQNLALGPLVLKEFRLPLKLERNRLVTGEVVKTIGNGRLRISPMETTDLLGDDPRASGSLETQDVLIENLLTSSPAGFSAKLNANLASLVFENGGFSVRGSAVMDIFGGTVEVSKFTLSELLSDLATLKCNIATRELSIEQATALVPGFGEMQGVLEADLRDFELNLAVMQPSRFEASFRTVKRPGVKQVISARALKSLSLSVSDLTKEYIAGNYPYKAFGIFVTLKNDMLRFRGHSPEKDEGYAEILTPPLVVLRKATLRWQEEVGYQRFEENMKKAIEGIKEAQKFGVEVEIK